MKGCAMTENNHGHTIHFFGHTFCNRHGCNTTRLSACHDLAFDLGKIRINYKSRYPVKLISDDLRTVKEEPYWVVFPEPVSPTMIRT